MSESSSQHPVFSQVGIDTVEPVQELDNGEIINSIINEGVVIEDVGLVTESLQYIRTELGVSDATFTDYGNRLLLVALARRISSIDTKDPLNEQESQYLSDMARSLQAPQKETDNFVVSDKHKKEVFDKYSQPELTREMRAYLNGSEFDGLRHRLGVTNEEPYEVRVLAIMDDFTAHGLVPTVDWTDKEKTYDEIHAEDMVRKGYQAGLKKRTQDFNQDTARDKLFAPAWVTHFDDGTKYLCITSPLAEKIMYPNEERANYYTESNYEDDVATLRHEYTHTQGEIVSGPWPGIALEELRAEHFSGNRLGYADVKRFFMGVRMITGYDAENGFEPEGRPYNRSEFLTDIARNLGLDGLIDAMLAIPEAYVNDENVPRFTRQLVQHFGGMSGAMRRIHERTIAQDGQNAVDERIAHDVDIVVKRLDSNEHVTVDSYFAYGGVDYLHAIAMENVRRRRTDK